MVEKIKTSVAHRYQSYPEPIYCLLMEIRKAIFEVAQKEGLGEVEETLKWNEPSFLAKYGSAIRIDWKPKHPNQYAIYFNCKTLLVETFKEIYGSTFQYEANRALLFNVTEPIPWLELKQCISMALRYHKIKHLPLLGI
jgi:hypothetical protein